MSSRYLPTSNFHAALNSYLHQWYHRFFQIQVHLYIQSWLNFFQHNKQRQESTIRGGYASRLLTGYLNISCLDHNLSDVYTYSGILILLSYFGYLIFVFLLGLYGILWIWKLVSNTTNSSNRVAEHFTTYPSPFKIKCS